MVPGSGPGPGRLLRVAADKLEDNHDNDRDGTRLLRGTTGTSQRRTGHHRHLPGSPHRFGAAHERPVRGRLSEHHPRLAAGQDCPAGQSPPGCPELIEATTDGGASWSVQYHGPLGIVGLDFVDESHGFALAGNRCAEPLGALALSAGLAGCGIGPQSAPRALDRSKVPFGLLSSTTTTTISSTEPSSPALIVYFEQSQHLVPVRRAVAGPGQCLRRSGRAGRRAPPRLAILKVH